MSDLWIKIRVLTEWGRVAASAPNMIGRERIVERLTELGSEDDGGVRGIRAAFLVTVNFVEFEPRGVYEKNATHG